MNFIIMTATDGTHEALEANEHESEELLEDAANCVVTTITDTITPDTTKCYKLTFDATSFESVFKIDVSRCVGRWRA